MPPQVHQSSDPGDFMDSVDGVESTRKDSLNDIDPRLVFTSKETEHCQQIIEPEARSTAISGAPCNASKVVGKDEVFLEW